MAKKSYWLKQFQSKRTSYQVWPTWKLELKSNIQRFKNEIILHLKSIWEELEYPEIKPLEGYKNCK